MRRRRSSTAMAWLPVLLVWVLAMAEVGMAVGNGHRFDGKAHLRSRKRVGADDGKRQLDLGLDIGFGASSSSSDPGFNIFSVFTSSSTAPSPSATPATSTSDSGLVASIIPSSSASDSSSAAVTSSSTDSSPTAVSTSSPLTTSSSSDASSSILPVTPTSAADSDLGLDPFLSSLLGITSSSTTTALTSTVSTTSLASTTSQGSTTSATSTSVATTSTSRASDIVSTTSNAPISTSAGVTTSAATTSSAGGIDITIGQFSLTLSTPNLFSTTSSDAGSTSAATTSTTDSSTTSTQDPTSASSTTPFLSISFGTPPATTHPSSTTDSSTPATSASHSSTSTPDNISTSILSIVTSDLFPTSSTSWSAPPSPTSTDGGQSSSSTTDQGSLPASTSSTNLETVPSSTSSTDLGSVPVTTSSAMWSSSLTASDPVVTSDSSSALATSTLQNSTSITTDDPLLSLSATPGISGSQVSFFSVSTSSSSSTSDSSTSDSSSTSTTSTDDAYVPTQTWLIVASTSPITTITSAPIASATSTDASQTTVLPTTATIPNSVPTLIVPANSVANNPNAGTGKADDPIKDDTLISLLLDANEYPWVFVVNSSDATSQLFNTFPVLISTTLNIDTSQVLTYGLQVYQPASWNGDQAGLLTQWLAYIPSSQFDTLNAYLKAQSSPLYSQTGIQGDLAAQINTAFPLAASSGVTVTQTGSSSSGNSSTKNRDIIIGVCVGVGGSLWIALVYWIYKRVKRSNEKAVHTRLSEHMSMFDDRFAVGGTAARDERRISEVPSISPSEIDDRPSSFYASPMDNDPAMRRQQRERTSEDGSYRSGEALESPTYGPSVFGSSWFQSSTNRDAGGIPPMRQAQNPFEDFVTRSYLTTSGSTGSGIGAGPFMAHRRSAVGKPVQKAMISGPTLHASSLEFREY